MSLNKEIGGYFELELRQGKEYHSSALRLNTGRNAFGYILIAKGYSKVYLPYYTCDVMLEPIKKLDLTVEFYHIDSEFRPVFDFSKVNKNEVFVYTNYFGLCDVQVKEISEVCENLIIDNAQAFFSKPLPNVDTFYSPRKFFGVPDGGYLYTDTHLADPFPRDNSEKRFKHLIGRVERAAEEHYADFKSNDKVLSKQPIKSMSKITQRILSSIDYNAVETQRKNNFEYLHSKLGGINQFNFEINQEAVPLVYPFLVEKPGLRAYLNSQKVYVAQYWPNVHQWVNEKGMEYYLAENLIHLPIDQRYGIREMKRIIKVLEEIL